ncbi:MAG: UDP-N-acetyl-D-mannosamine dehydrogenase [Candidatus Kapaibacterium sp.]|nr:MAG: UDP-N-acetyl-D-mannosamine dehydrogenase [Candidatus Kapabacteria bacterium]
MKVAVLGLGYVGLPLALAIKKRTNHDVVGYDPKAEKVDKILKGICPIEDAQAERDLKEVKLKASTNEEIIDGSDIYFVCVPTPVLDDYTPDLRPLTSAIETIAKFLHRGQYVVIESTVNPGVCDELVVPMLENLTGLKVVKDFNVVHCPERINPGDPKWNVYNIPRNIGSTSPEATKFIADFYRSVLDAEIHEMPDLKTTEATKIIENTFRDINIAFVNELAKSFEVLGIDILAVINGASNKPFAFLPHYPGCGVGGHCIPVDPYYLIDRASKSGFDHKFLKLAREINNSMPAHTVNHLVDALNKFSKSVKGTRIALLGLSYKPNLGDLRESPALKIKKLLEEKEADLVCFDPYVKEFSNVASIEEALTGAFAILLATAHNEFRVINGELLSKYEVKVVIDGRNFLDKEDIQKYGIYYKGIGR